MSHQSVRLCDGGETVKSKVCVCAPYVRLKWDESGQRIFIRAKMALKGNFGPRDWTERVLTSKVLTSEEWSELQQTASNKFLGLFALSLVQQPQGCHSPT